MRRVSFLVSIVALAIVLGGSVAGGRFAAGAQEGTPTAAPVAGVAPALLGAGLPEAAPGHELALRRFVFQPGGAMADHVHSGALVLHVESGALTYAIREGEVAVQRAAADGTPGPTERFGPGDEIVLTAGDALFEQGIVHSARNDGAEPTVVWVASIGTAGETFTVFDLP